MATASAFLIKCNVNDININFLIYISIFLQNLFNKLLITDEINLAKIERCVNNDKETFFIVLKATHSNF